MFDVTFKNVPDGALGALIAQVGTKRYSVKLTHRPHPDQEGGKHPATKTKKYNRMPGSTVLTMTGKSAQKGSTREKILLTFEKLEAKHDIGTVTRDMLRKETSKQGLDSTVIGQLIAGGFLRPLQEK
jgi:hypothetical protein